MADLGLTARAFLGGYSRQFGENSLEEVPDLGIVCIACPLGGEGALSSAVSGAWNIPMPAVGASSTTEDGAVQLLGMARDQMFALFAECGTFPAAESQLALGDAGYCTDQTDNWCILKMEGPDSVAALERICMLDLDPSTFPVGAAARTVMEHLGTIILRSSNSEFILLSASSSASSFLHAVETSLQNVT